MARIETELTPTNSTPPTILNVALVGNPNSGKTTLFNALTGLRQKVGNYPGVTVEKKEGRVTLPNGTVLNFIDLPGLYSLVPHSPDEQIAREVLLGLRTDTPRPDVVVNVVDASNLERNLYLTSQILDIGIPLVVALTMQDVLEKQETSMDVEVLTEQVGVTCVAVSGTRKQGIENLLSTIQRAPTLTPPQPTWNAPEVAIRVLERLQTTLQKEHDLTPRIAFVEAISLLMMKGEMPGAERLSKATHDLLEETRLELADAEIDFPTTAIEARYAWIGNITEKVLHRPPTTDHRPISFNERIDRVVMHRVWGYVLFFAVMALVFQSIFSWTKPPMDMIKSGIEVLGKGIEARMPEGDFRDLLVGGVLGGVGNTVVFLPQILMLFFFISLLEDTGYMARAAFLMDRLMSKVGLHGKSFIPLLSSFACAIPAVMATRTIGDRKARLITILVAPLMSCSARLPVYTLMIGAFMPNIPVLKIGSVTLLTLPGVTLITMYFMGMIVAFCIAGLFHKALLKGVSPTFMMELPPYRLPSLKSAIFEMVERAGLFLRRATTLILAISTVLWFLSTYPKRPDLPPEQRVAHSFAGQMGHAMEPLIRPLGFDWKIGVGLVASFAAREVFVSAMGTVYNVGDTEEAGFGDLQTKMRDDVDSRTGQKVFSPLVAVSLMIYYVLAMQCMSTFAVVRRETNGWKWPLFQLGYMTALAWLGSFVVYQVGQWMHWGGG
jgi:ferrous iron transport protein B